jgi:small subunit ribosomal protein S1
MFFYPEGKNSALSVSFSNTDEAVKAMESESIIESKVLLCDREHNLHVDLGALRGIIPREEGAIGISDGSVRDIALISRVNKSVCFFIKSFKKDVYGNTCAVLSRRGVQEKCISEYLNTLSNGDIIDAAVTHLERFGAFIDVGAGVNALIPIDMLSVSRISHPAQRLCEGQSIRAALKNRENGRLTFTLKELLGTWSENAGCFCAGDTVTGIVRSVEEYGIFIELAPNLAGLAEYQDGITEGQEVAVFIKAVIPEKMKIKLIIVEAFEECATPKSLRYFETGDRIERWRYSPDGCGRIIETVFEADS